MRQKVGAGYSSPRTEYMHSIILLLHNVYTFRTVHCGHAVLNEARRVIESLSQIHNWEYISTAFGRWLPLAQTIQATINLAFFSSLLMSLASCPS